MSSGEKFYTLDGDKLDGDKGLNNNRNTIPERRNKSDIDSGFNISNIDNKTLNELDKCCTLSSATNLKGLRITPKNNWKGGVIIDGNPMYLGFFEIGKETINLQYIDKHIMNGTEVIRFETTDKNGAVMKYMFYGIGMEI